MSKKIFISYKREDEAFARRLREFLQNHNSMRISTIPRQKKVSNRMVAHTHWYNKNQP